MPELMVNLPVRPTEGEIAGLKSALFSVARMQELPAKSFSLDPAGLAFIVGFSADALQVADILFNWLKSLRRCNSASVRLSDGRLFKLESTSDPQQFIAQLRAALEEL